MLLIQTIVVTPYQQNARILMDDQAKTAVIVDPGGDVHLIMDALPVDYTCQEIWVTHSHIDHVSGVASLLKECANRQGVPIIVAHPEDAVNREHLPMQSQMMGFPYSGAFDVDQLVQHGDTRSVGEFQFKVLHTPGHALGHISLFCDSEDNDYQAPVLIAGDALFKGSIGRTDLPGGNHQGLLDSITHHLFSLPEHTIVCCGHGPNTTIGEEKATNPFF